VLLSTAAARRQRLPGSACAPTRLQLRCLTSVSLHKALQYEPAQSVAVRFRQAVHDSLLGISGKGAAA
jgi:hypothetical protein